MKNILFDWFLCLYMDGVVFKQVLVTVRGGGVYFGLGSIRVF